MKSNLKVVNLIVSGKIPLKRKLKVNEFDKLILKCGWFLPREKMILLSKQFNYRKKVELNVHKKQKNPYVTIWFSGAIIIVGLKNKKEASDIYDLVIKDIKKCCPGALI